MRCSFTVEGIDLHEVPKQTIFEYFSKFGDLSDHIVRSKGSTKVTRTDLQEERLLVLFSLTYRKLAVDEEVLTKQLHLIDGVEVLCKPVQAIQMIEASGRRVFIKYLDKKASLEDIYSSLSQFGQIEFVQLSMKKDKSLNLGLCNVTFVDRASAIKVLNEPSINIRNKKVKVELFQSPQIDSSKLGTCQISAQCGSQVDDQQQSPMNEQQTTGVYYSKQMYLQTSVQTLNKPSKGIKSLSDLELSVDRHFTRPTASNDGREAAHYSLVTVYSLNKLPLIPIVINRSLNNSLIEEECEESPRRKNSPSLEPRMSTRQIEPKLNMQYESKASELTNSRFAISGASLHSIKPTRRQYYVNPRQLRSIMQKNHKQQNIRINLLH